MSERSPLLTAARPSSSSTPSHFSDGVDQSAQHRKFDTNDSDDDNNLSDCSTRRNISPWRGATIAVTIFILIFILTYGVAVITTIQSHIAADLQVTSNVSWLFSAYLIANTAVTPVSGKFCEIFSPRAYLLVSTLIQIIGLLLTAFASSLRAFIVGRVICGIGAAAVTPVSLILVTELASQRRWGMLFGFINCAYTIGIALGAIIGGGLEPKIGWRAVFWTQAPICLIVGLVAFFAIPPRSREHTSTDHDKMTISQQLGRIDYFGNVTMIGAVVLLLYALASPEIDMTAAALAAAMLALFCLVESRWAIDPVIPPEIICSRAMLMTGIATVGFMAARWQVMFYVPAYGIAVRGWTQAQAGVLLIATNFGFGSGSVIVGSVHIKKSGSYYKSCLVCLVIFVIEHFALSRLLVSDSPVWLLIVALFVNGFIAGALLNYNLVHLLHLTKPVHHATVMPLNAMFRSLSGSVGSALSGGIFVRTLQNSLHEGFENKGIYGKGKLIMQLLSRPLLVQQLAGPERAVAEDSYATSIQYLFVVGCVWVVVMIVCQAFTGWTAPDEGRADAQLKRDSTDDEPVSETTPSAN